MKQNKQTDDYKLEWYWYIPIVLIMFLIGTQIANDFQKAYEECVEDCVEYNELHNCTYPNYPCCVCNVWG